MKKEEAIKYAISERENGTGWKRISQSLKTKGFYNRKKGKAYTAAHINNLVRYTKTTETNNSTNPFASTLRGILHLNVSDKAKLAMINLAVAE